MLENKLVFFHFSSDREQDPDPFFHETDPRICIRINMKRIRNTAWNDLSSLEYRMESLIFKQHNCFYSLFVCSQKWGDEKMRILKGVRQLRKRGDESERKSILQNSWWEREIQYKKIIRIRVKCIPLFRCPWPNCSLAVETENQIVIHYGLNHKAVVKLLEKNKLNNTEVVQRVPGIRSDMLALPSSYK